MVLESALEVVCSLFDTDLEAVKTEALNLIAKLTKKVTTDNLGYLLSLKGNLTRLLARVQKAKDEIEKMLDEDEDMAGFYLTRKWHKNQQARSRDDVKDLEMMLEAYLIEMDWTRFIQ
ncbi:unnamed protein product [Thlaspi arvense]|uniref:Uncharacterized protein n=1 Tax=Thlaspi arvense TaxID=13288 RepID=A0AAU9T6F2_THLAR|nr:unnamed protein product [Thlaspi arvense]